MNRIKKAYCRTYQKGFKTALPVLPYRNPEMLEGVEAIPDVLRVKGVKSVLLVADGGVRRLGLTEKLESLLDKAGIVCNVHEQNRPNPTISDVELSVESYKIVDANAIIAVGGGSAMDCAKATGARIARPDKTISDMKGILKVMKKTPLLIAVPTTAGTGSETTLAAVITDEKTHHKYPINDFNLIPDYAVLDPYLTVGLPPFITATTGLDALTHAVEAYIGGSTTKLTRSMSEDAVLLINYYLRRAVKQGDDIEARKGMLRAAYYAGISFTRSYVGYVHGVAHSLGGQYGIAHGLANAVLLPRILEVYGDAIYPQLAVLAKKTHVAEKYIDDEKAAKKFIQWIYDMCEEFGLPETFPEIKEEDIPVMAAHADEECNPLYPVPVLMGPAELEKLYRLVMVKEENEEEQ